MPGLSKLVPKPVKDLMNRAATMISEAIAPYVKVVVDASVEALIDHIFKESSHLVKKLIAGKLELADLENPDLFSEVDNVLKALSNFLVENEFEITETNSSTMKKIASKLEKKLVSTLDITKKIIDGIVPGIAIDIGTDTTIKNIVLELSKLETVNLHNKNRFFSDIEAYLYHPNPRPELSPLNKTRMINILQLIIDVFRVLIVIEPFPPLKGLDGCALLTDTAFMEKLKNFIVCCERRKEKEVVLFSLLIEIFTKVIQRAKLPFNVKDRHDGVTTFYWVEDINAFSPFRDPFVKDPDLYGSIHAIKEKDSNSNINLMVFIIVLFKNIVAELDKNDKNRKRSGSGSTDSEGSSGRHRGGKKSRKPGKRLKKQTRKR
jgi:hypothetical protein